MASTATSGDIVVERRQTIHKYHWPATQLNVWMIFMVVASCAILGMAANFAMIQNTLLLAVPWYIPYLICVSALTIIFTQILLWLIFQRRLLPAIVIIGGFMFFVLWLTGFIVVSIQLWGSSGSINNACSALVFNDNPTGQTEHTLAWLQQRSICQSWQAVFSLLLVGTLFLLWLIVMAYQVYANN